MPRLVALDLAGGTTFVDSLRRVWDRGDAVLPVDQRLPAVAKAALVAALAPASVIDADGDETVVGAGLPVDDGDAVVLATSGSTGTPKGVVLTHRALLAGGTASNSRLAVTSDDHWLACLPLSHVGGFGVVSRALLAGTRLTVHAGFDAGAVERSDASLVSLVATALNRIDASRFRRILLGGARPPTVTAPNVITTYGLTESGGGVVYDGVPLEGVEVRVDGGGEIMLSGPCLLRCYRDGTDPTVGGWLPTGDLGRWLPDGTLHVDGRRGDLIVTGGENVWPEPIEDVLRHHPLVADVAVVGTDDDEWGQVVTAYVVARDEPPALDDLRSMVKEHLPAFMAPHRLVLVDHIPTTTSGKPRRGELH